jgi:twitching motility protein PilT
MSSDLKTPIYPASAGVLSLADLLAVFTDPANKHEGISRFSDLHIRSGEIVRYRFDGDLICVDGGVRTTEEMAKALILPLLSDEDRATLAANPLADIDCGYTLPGTNTNFRINAFRSRGGLGAVIRILPDWIPDIHELGFPNRQVVDDIVNAQQGLVIVTGITGSGKSTTIASLLKHIAQHRAVHIISLEDPVEFILPSGRALVSQREVGLHVAGFPEGLRSALREDPDVIFVGEIRDRESASLALSAAETGHLVVTTLHTRDTRGAITRLVDLFPADRLKELCVQLSFSLFYVIAQRLVQRADGKGRRIAVEVMRNNHAIAAILRSGNWQQLYSVLETQQRDGMTTTEQHLAELVRTRQITREEALSQCNDPVSLQHLL